ncbi:hypothetical protein [Flavobacterium branchiicola]|uniref:Type ISP restriction-modification enzyme LLaBIII C-terminal specificity domain-containing protein n=1 Tax=Flavobacterium branchiicola TaxID=1114875 RepID=A0ABV9PGE0_9FLAO|nr:hypothetical protein [Flavobacterium branchiicola]MBS7256025.1 hypothetical protein [Flavobacterium branchiicola]
MTTQYYLNRIKKSPPQQNIKYSDLVDLENIAFEISQNDTEISFTLNTFFQGSENKTTTINTEIVNLFAKYSGLVFLDEKETGNICFANSDEVRAEYRQSFTLFDFLDYIYAFVHSSLYRESREILIPSETILFWQMVKIGFALRKEIK